MTDPIREAREAGRQRPGIVYLLPRAARPDARLSIDAAPPEAAALSRGEQPPTVVDIPEPGLIATAWIALAQAPILQTATESLLWSIPAKEELPTPRPLV